MAEIILRIKRYFWMTSLYKWYNKKRQNHLYKLRKPYLPAIRNILGSNASIISSNCFAGRIIQDLDMAYNTPTVGLFIWSSDFIEFLRHLKYYLTEAKLEFVEQSKYELGNQIRYEKTKNGEWFPIALLDGKVEVVFLHYHSEEEARTKWYRRSSRINWDNLFIIGMEQNLCKVEDIIAFDALQYNHKIFFSTKKIPEALSNYRIKEFKVEIGNAYEQAHFFYKAIVDRFR